MIELVCSHTILNVGQVAGFEQDRFNLQACDLFGRIPFDHGQIFLRHFQAFGMSSTSHHTDSYTVKTTLLEVEVIVRVEVVKPDDHVAIGEQAVGQVKAYEASCTGDQRPVPL